METQKNIFNLKIFSDRKSMVIFVACLIVSAIFWLLLSLSEEYQEYVPLRIKYKNLPEDKVLIQQLPKEARVLIRAKGFKILGIQSGFTVDDILIDVKKITFVKKGDYYVCDWVNSAHLADFSARDDKRMAVLSIDPDTIHFVMDHKLSKVLPLCFSRSSTPTQNLRIIGAVEVSPDSVHVTGPRHLLKNMNCLYTTNLNLPAFEGRVERQVLLVVPAGTSIAEGASARVRFLVQRMKKRTFEVLISAQNIPFGEELKLLPGAVTVNFLATDSTFSKLSKSDFFVVADYRDLMLSQNKIEVQLRNFPQDIESPSLSPAKVEYLLRK